MHKSIVSCLLIRYVGITLIEILYGENKLDFHFCNTREYLHGFLCLLIFSPRCFVGILNKSCMGSGPLKFNLRQYKEIICTVSCCCVII